MGTMYSMHTDPVGDALAGLNSTHWSQSYEFKWFASSPNNSNQSGKKQVSFLNKYTIGAVCGAVIAIACYKAYNTYNTYNTQQESDESEDKP